MYKSFARFVASASKTEKFTLVDAQLDEKLRSNAWALTSHADHPIYLVRAFEALKFDDIDLFKIDCDGQDFRVLNSLDGHFDRLGILAVRMAVKLFGSIENIYARDPLV